MDMYVSTNSTVPLIPMRGWDLLMAVHLRIQGTICHNPHAPPGARLLSGVDPALTLNCYCGDLSHLYWYCGVVPSGALT